MANPISINEQALILSLGIGVLTSLILFTMSFAIERIQSETVEVKPQSQQSSSQEINNTLESYGTKTSDLSSQITERERRENEFLQKRKKDLKNELEALKKKEIVNKRIIKEEGLEEFENELEKLLNEDTDYSESLQNLFNESKRLSQEIQQSQPQKPSRGIPIDQKLESIPEVDETISIEPVQESQTQSTYVKKLAALLSQNLDNKTLMEEKESKKIQYDVKKLEPVENTLQAKTQKNLTTQGQDKKEMLILKRFVPSEELFRKFSKENQPPTQLTTSSEAIPVQGPENKKKGPD